MLFTRWHGSKKTMTAIFIRHAGIKHRKNSLKPFIMMKFWMEMLWPLPNTYLLTNVPVWILNRLYKWGKYQRCKIGWKLMTFIHQNLVSSHFQYHVAKLLIVCTYLWRYSSLFVFWIPLGIIYQSSVNLQYNTLVCWVDGPNDSLTKRLMLQVLFFS